MKKSTRAFLQEAKSTAHFSLFDRLHGYIYLRWPYLYIAVGKGKHPLAKMTSPLLRLYDWLSRKKNKEKSPGMADMYHGKAMPLESVKQLVNIKQEIQLENLEQVIPFSRAKDIILKNPESIAVIDCPCRRSVPNPCLPLDVCIIVGEPFASFALEHHPNNARRITQAEAQTILEEEDQRGHVHHAFFKDAMLNRFYAICNCCSCCCGAMLAHQHGTPMLISSGYICQVEELLCVGCGACAKVCQFDAISMEEVAHIDSRACLGCGVCVNHCPQGALKLVRDETKPQPLEIKQLISRQKITL